MPVQAHVENGEAVTATFGSGDHEGTKARASHKGAEDQHLARTETADEVDHDLLGCGQCVRIAKAHKD